MKLAFLTPNRKHRYNRGHDSFREAFAKQMETVYIGEDYPVCTYEAREIAQLYKPDVIATYGLKYTEPYKHIRKVNVLRVHFVCDYLTPFNGFKGYDKKYDQMLKRDRYDVLFCRTLHAVKCLSERGFRKDRIFFLPFSVSPKIYHPNGEKRKIDVSTCWTLLDGFYPNRKTIQLTISKNLRCNFFTGNVEMNNFVKTLQNSKISLNSLSYLKGLNMKVFEAMACGALCLTEEAEEMKAIGLIPGKHLVTFKGVDDCMDKIRYYLKNSSEMEAIAKAGSAEVMLNHTHDTRVKTVKHLLEAII